MINPKSRPWTCNWGHKEFFLPALNFLGSNLILNFYNVRCFVSVVEIREGKKANNSYLPKTAFHLTSIHLISMVFLSPVTRGC